MRRLSCVLVGIACAVAAFLFSTGCSKQSKQNMFGAIPEVEFDASMGKDCSEFRFVTANADDMKRYNSLKTLYEKNLPSKVAASEIPKIPKIIHQIWLGPKTPPACLATFREKWKALHPDWEYRLWTDADLDSLNLEMRDLIDASPNYGEKSDILRSELLERFGGLYIDVDMECQHNFEELHRKYDFYAGAEYPHKIATVNNRIWVGISIMASRPHHPILKRWKEYIRACWDKVNALHSSPIERVINHTFFNFSKAVFENCHDEKFVNIVLPATYFYPLSAANAAKRRSQIRGFREKVYDVLETLHLKRPRPFSRVYPESLAVHFWGNSWQSSTIEQLKDLQQQLDLLRKDIFTMQQRVRQLESMPVAKEGSKQRIQQG